MPTADHALKRQLPDQYVGRCIFEYTFAHNARVLRSGTVQQFPPASGTLRSRDIDGFRVDRECLSSQTGYRDVNASTVAVDFQQQIFAFLRGHSRIQSLKLVKLQDLLRRARSSRAGARCRGSSRRQDRGGNPNIRGAD